ncbi:MAG TPA: Tad domain-containing protein [Candidatus Limnocylindrales bacterium]|nr:Tad domain-containing protein [Candidatus Limnocylindrales bacterium]
MTRRRRAGERGQVLVLVVIGMVGLLGAASLAFDVGRFYSERRFLQNAADAGALAIGSALVRGETSTSAEAIGRDVLARNLLASPSGSTAVVATTPQYATGHAGEPTYLTSGILISGTDVRVAVQSSVGYTFGRAIGLGDATIGATAHVRTNGDMLPIAIRHYLNAPGPTSGATSPCDGDTNDFQDLLSTANTSCLGSATNATLRSTPSSGDPFDASHPDSDPVHHGPVIALVGDGASPGNNASFRGFIALDIRDFSTATSNVFYNDVTSGTQPNVLKAKESGWVATGYPGPAFPPATSPPDPNDQVGIMDGNSAGIVVDAIDDRYAPGDEVLAAVYSGTVMTIPDFSYTVASTVTIGQTEDRSNAVTMSLTKNNAFSGVVSTSAFANWGASTPYGTTLQALTFSPTPAAPAVTVTWTHFQTVGAPVGIYPIWVQGHSSSPYLTDHYAPVAVKIGTVDRDFSSTGGGLVISMASTGSTSTGTMAFSTPNKDATYFGGTVNLTVEGGPQDLGVLPTGIGPVSVTPSSFTLGKGGNQTATISINGGTLGPGEYPLTIRATGTNKDGLPVTRMIPFTVDIATAGTSNQYVDIEGFAVFRIASIDANTVYGYAITGSYADMNDPALRRGQVVRLAPW